MFRRIFGGIACLIILLITYEFVSEIISSTGPHYAYRPLYFMLLAITYLFFVPVSVYYLISKKPVLGLEIIALKIHIFSFGLFIVGLFQGLISNMLVSSIRWFLELNQGVIILLSILLFIIGDTLLIIGLYKNRKNNNKNAGV